MLDACFVGGMVGSEVCTLSVGKGIVSRHRVGVLALGLTSALFCLFAAIAPGMDHGRWTLVSSLSMLMALLVVSATFYAFWQPGAGFLLILIGLVEAVLLLAAMLSRTGYLLRDVLLSILPTGGLAILAGALAVDSGIRTEGSTAPGRRKTRRRSGDRR